MNPLKFLALIGIPALLLAVLYTPALDYGFVWMDHTEIEKGAMILPSGDLGGAFFRPVHVVKGYSLQHSVSPYYRPLQLAIVSGIHHQYGLSTWHYHLVSLFVGMIYVTAFAVLAWLLFGRFWPALVATLLVTAHPAGIEAFVWLSAVSEGMGGVWILGSLIAALRCVRSPTQRESLVFGVLSWVALIGGLLSKETSVVLPALLAAMLMSSYFAGQPEGSASGKRPGDGGVLLGMQALTVLAYLLILRPTVLGVVVGEAPLHGSWVTQWLTALSLWPRSIAWLFAPFGSTTSDVVRVATTLAEPRVWLGLALALASLLAWIALLRARRGIAAFGLAWLWIAYLPTANLAPMIHARGDRYLFLSIVGAALLVVDLVPELLGRLVPRYRRVVLPALALCSVATLAGLTWARIPDWRSTLILFEHDVALDPDFREGRFHLANQYFDLGDYGTAQDHLDILLSQIEGKGSIKSYVNLFGVYQLACLNLIAQSRFTEAAALVRTAAHLHPETATHPPVLDCLGQSLEQAGKPSEALDTYQDLLTHLTTQPPPGILLAIARCHVTLGRPDEARRWLQRAQDLGLQNARHRNEASRIEGLIEKGGVRG